MTGHAPRRAPLAFLGLLAWTAVLATAALALHRVGGALAPPPLSEPGQLSDWLGDREPAEAAMAVVRLIVLGTAWYLVAATVAGTLARAAGVASWVRAADALSVPLVRRLVNGALGVSLATAALAGAGSAAVADERAGPAPVAAEAVTMRQLPDTAGPAPATTAGAAAGVPTMRRLDDPTTTTTTTTTTPTSTPPAVEQAQAPAPAADPAATWEIQPGEHFWSVAERVLTSAWGRAPSDAEVDPYWRRLVDANSDVLRDRGNPDLLFPGQVITVPPPPAPPA